MTVRTVKAIARRSLVGILWVMLAGCQGTGRGPDRITVDAWGEIDGSGIAHYTLDNGRMRVGISNFGGTLTGVHTPDRRGALDDILLGCGDLEALRSGYTPFVGLDGRIDGRGAGARDLAGVVWESDHELTPEGPELHLWHRFRDGLRRRRVDVQVIYTLTHDDELRVVVTAIADRPTAVSFFQNGHWNLAGHASGTVLDQTVQVAAARYSAAEETGGVPDSALPVAGTPFDYRVPKPIGYDIEELPPRGNHPGGYDLRFVIDGEWGALRRAARVHDPVSGRVLELLTDAPWVRFRSGDALGGVRGKDGTSYPKHGGFSLVPRTGGVADALSGPWALLSPGETYRHVVVYRFRTDRRGRIFWREPETDVIPASHRYLMDPDESTGAGDLAEG